MRGLLLPSTSCLDPLFSSRPPVSRPLVTQRPRLPLAPPVSAPAPALQTARPAPVLQPAQRRRPPGRMGCRYGYPHLLHPRRHRRACCVCAATAREARFAGSAAPRRARRTKRARATRSAGRSWARLAGVSASLQVIVRRGRVDSRRGR